MAKLNDMAVRDHILDDIANIAVLTAMSDIRKAKLQRCDLCSGRPINDFNMGNELCKDDTDCTQYGFTECESINSAKNKIKEILSGRV